MALQLLQSLCTAVTECNFKIDNPYIFKTKADVVTSLSTNQACTLDSLHLFLCPFDVQV